MIYYILIEDLCNFGKLTTAREVFYSLPTNVLQLDVPTYSIMIKGLCQEELIDEACELLEKWDGNGGSPNDRTYNKVIQGLLQHDATSKALKHLQIMVDKGFFGKCNQSIHVGLNYYLQIQEIKQCKNYFNNLYEGF